MKNLLAFADHVLKGADLKSFYAPFIAQDDVETASVSPFCWQQNCFFEINDFKLQTS